MRKVELKIHPGKIYEVHEKEFTDLVNLKMIARVVEETSETVKAEEESKTEHDEKVQSHESEETPVKKRTTARKTSPKDPSE